MPTYEYRCSACHAEYELREGFDAPSLHACQRCGAGDARRVLRAPAVVFKGSGFYATDNRGSGGSEDKKDSNSADKKGSSSADSGTGGASAEGGEKAAASTSSDNGGGHSHGHGHSHGPDGHSH